MDDNNNTGQLLKLRCLVVDDDNNLICDVFSVHILSTAEVEELRSAIKDKQGPALDYLSGSQLGLWKVVKEMSTARAGLKVKEIRFPNPVFDDEAYESGDVRLLDVTETLSTYRFDLSKPKQLHIIARVLPRSVEGGTHTSRGSKRKLEEQAESVARKLLKSFAKHTPSSLARPTHFHSAADRLVKCNRPFEYDTLPIALLQEEFANFKDDCAQEPSVTAIQLLEDLTAAACTWYDTESGRRDAINKFINGSQRITDGHSTPVIIPALIRECKNNEGCALFEAIGYYVKFLEKQLNFEKYTRFPSILMTDIGPQIGLYGCIWSGKEILVEPLTPIYDLTAHWTDEEARTQIAASLHAVKKAVARIDQHYRDIGSKPSEIQREYPYPTSFEDGKGLWTKFTYTSRISDKLVFTAVSETKQRLVIKFTRQYSETVHRFLADLGHAPTLRAVDNLPGRWKMIVMEESQYTRLDDLTDKLDEEAKLTIKRKVIEVIVELHAQELVHGDIRPVNTFVDEDTLGRPEGVSIHVIDFDWAGQVGMVRYPLRVNTKSVLRPSDVEGGVLIAKIHDMYMIDSLLK